MPVTRRLPLRWAAASASHGLGSGQPKLALMANGRFKALAAGQLVTNVPASLSTVLDAAGEEGCASKRASAAPPSR